MLELIWFNLSLFRGENQWCPKPGRSRSSSEMFSSHHWQYSSEWTHSECTCIRELHSPVHVHHCGKCNKKGHRRQRKGKQWMYRYVTIRQQLCLTSTVTCLFLLIRFVSGALPSSWKSCWTSSWEMGESQSLRSCSASKMPSDTASRLVSVWNLMNWDPNTETPL